MMMRRHLRRAYLTAMDQEARKHTMRLQDEANRLGIPDALITIEVHGQLRADAYMRAGWSPLSEVQESQQWGSFKVNVPVLTLQIERWK